MQTKIDCSIAENYVVELSRMCDTYTNCCKCGLHKLNPGWCRKGQGSNPKQAIEIVQAWSDEHPIDPVVTRQDKFLELYPNVEVAIDGLVTIMPCMLGEIKTHSSACQAKSCFRCKKDYWSQPYKEV